MVVIVRALPDGPTIATHESIGELTAVRSILDGYRLLCKLALSKAERRLLVVR